MFAKNRLPLGALLRNEQNSNVFLILKAKPLDITTDYSMCKIYEPSQPDQSIPFTFYRVTDSDKLDKYTVMNATPIIEGDGEYYYKLSTFDFDDVDRYSVNMDFMLRLLTACKYYEKKKKVFSLLTLDKKNKTVFLKRKATFLEKFILRTKEVVIEIDWGLLLLEYKILIPKTLVEHKFINQINDNCYFCKCGTANE